MSGKYTKSRSKSTSPTGTSSFVLLCRVKLPRHDLDIVWGSIPSRCWPHGTDQSEKRSKCRGPQSWARALGWRHNMAHMMQQVVVVSIKLDILILLLLYYYYCYYHCYCYYIIHKWCPPYCVGCIPIVLLDPQFCCSRSHRLVSHTHSLGACFSFFRANFLHFVWEFLPPHSLHIFSALATPTNWWYLYCCQVISLSTGSLLSIVCRSIHTLVHGSILPKVCYLILYREIASFPADRGWFLRWSPMKLHPPWVPQMSLPARRPFGQNVQLAAGRKRHRWTSSKWGCLNIVYSIQHMEVANAVLKH